MWIARARECKAVVSYHHTTALWSDRARPHFLKRKKKKKKVLGVPSELCIRKINLSEVHRMGWVGEVGRKGGSPSTSLTASSWFTTDKPVNKSKF